MVFIYSKKFLTWAELENWVLFQWPIFQNTASTNLLLFAVLTATKWFLNDGSLASNGLDDIYQTFRIVIGSKLCRDFLYRRGVKNRSLIQELLRLLKLNFSYYVFLSAEHLNLIGFSVLSQISGDSFSFKGNKKQYQSLLWERPWKICLKMWINQWWQWQAFKKSVGYFQ